MTAGKVLSLLILALIIPLQPLWSLEAGVSRIEMTPEPGVRMIGFGPRVSTGVADPLYVRGVVFRSGKRCIGFVVHDICMPLGRKLQADLRRKIMDRTGLEELIFHVIHTHSGPEIKNGRIDELRDYEQAICNKTIAAVEAAYSSLQPVRIGAGRGRVDLNYERHRVHPDGRVENLWQNHQKIRHGPVDRTVGVIKIDDLQGNPMAVLVNYACHPVIYGKDWTVYSADFPGILCAEIQQRVAGNPECVFFQGCAGDMNPYFANAVDPKARVEETGKELADGVLKVLAEIDTRPYTGDLSVVYDMKELETGVRYDLAKWQPDSELDKKSLERMKRIAGEDNIIKLPLSAVLITPEIGFVGLPGEPYVKHQQNMRLQSPVRHLFVCGYTTGSCGYLPTIAGAVTGGYGGNGRATLAEVGAGEHLVIDAVVSLYKLLDMLKPMPSGGKSGHLYPKPSN